MEYYFCSPSDEMVRVFFTVHEFKNLVYALQYSGLKSELGGFDVDLIKAPTETFL